MWEARAIIHFKALGTGPNLFGLVKLPSTKDQTKKLTLLVTALIYNDIMFIKVLDIKCLIQRKQCFQSLASTWRMIRFTPQTQIIP